MVVITCRLKYVINLLQWYKKAIQYFKTLSNILFIKYICIFHSYIFVFMINYLFIRCRTKMNRLLTMISLSPFKIWHLFIFLWVMSTVRYYYYYYYWRYSPCFFVTLLSSFIFLSQLYHYYKNHFILILIFRWSNFILSVNHVISMATVYLKTMSFPWQSYIPHPSTGISKVDMFKIFCNNFWV